MIGDNAALLEQPVGDHTLFYIYLGIALVITLYLVIKGKTNYKVELFFLSFYLMTGNINNVLTFALPGVSFFEIQPDRFLFLLFSFFLLRRIYVEGIKSSDQAFSSVPWFKLILFLFVFLLITSQITHVNDIGASIVIVSITEVLTFIVIIQALQIMASKQAFDIIGKAIIIGAVVSSLVSLIQFGIDPMFMRYGDMRLAFGQILRSNGLFNGEYNNSYFLITATAWALITISNKALRYFLLCLFTLGVITTFHRTSWIVFVLMVVIYFLIVEKVSLGRVALAGLTSAVVVLFFYQEITGSQLVQERLSDTPGGRLGYYTMVVNHIGEKPLFGYGGRYNDTYYYSMLRITRDRKRATGEEGGIHNGYLTSLFYYGIPTFICFTAFVILSVFYFGNLTKYHVFFVLPFLLALQYMIGNLTNDFLLVKYLAMLYAIHLGLGMGARQLPDYFPQPFKSPTPATKSVFF